MSWSGLSDRLDASPRRQYAALALITLVAAALRLYRLGDWSFWIDEIYTIYHAQRHFATLELLLQNVPPSTNWVPTSVILTAQVLNLSGVSEQSARLVSAGIGTLSIPVLFFPIRRLLGTPLALIAMLLLAFSPWHIYWSQNARGYTALMLLCALALFAFYEGIERDRPLFLIAFLLLLYLAASERLIALLILPVVVVYLVVSRFMAPDNPPILRVRRIFRTRNLVLILSPGIVLIISEVLSLLIGGDSLLSRISDEVEEVVSTFSGRPVENPFTLAVFIGFEIGIPLLTFSVFSGLYWLTGRSRLALLIFVSAVVPLALVITMAPFMFTEERYALLTLPSWLIMAAFGLKEIWLRTKNKERMLALGLVALLLTDAAGASLRYYHTNNGNRHDWRGAFGVVREKVQDEDVVVSTFPELGYYYLHRDVVPWDETDFVKVQARRERTWFVVIPDMAWFTGTERLYWWVSHNAFLIDVLYLRTVDNVNIEVYLYDPANPANRYYAE